MHLLHSCLRALLTAETSNGTEDARLGARRPCARCYVPVPNPTNDVNPFLAVEESIPSVNAKGHESEQTNS
eukprot:scaffold205736_cov32-Tisochrysis_lutea.AAC.3